MDLLKFICFPLQTSGFCRFPQAEGSHGPSTCPQPRWVDRKCRRYPRSQEPASLSLRKWTPSWGEWEWWAQCGVFIMEDPCTQYDSRLVDFSTSSEATLNKSFPLFTKINGPFLFGWQWAEEPGHMNLSGQSLKLLILFLSYPINLGIVHYNLVCFKVMFPLGFFSLTHWLFNTALFNFSEDFPVLFLWLISFFILL